MYVVRKGSHYDWYVEGPVSEAVFEKQRQRGHFRGLYVRIAVMHAQIEECYREIGQLKNDIDPFNIYVAVSRIMSEERIDR